MTKVKAIQKEKLSQKRLHAVLHAHVDSRWDMGGWDLEIQV